jgi:hypothetical protein
MLYNTISGREDTMAQAKSHNETVQINCMFPTPKHPFYHLRVFFNISNGVRYRISKVSANGDRVLDYFIFHAQRPQKDRRVGGGGLNEIIIRCDWKAGQEIKVDLGGISEDKKSTLSLAGKTVAPPKGGYWNSSWKYYAGIVLTEAAGIARKKEPVHVTFGLYSDRVSDPEKEMRIVSVDPDTGAAREIPSQVYTKSRYDTEEISERYQPTTIFEAAFFADVPAHESRVYLAFYGNPDARKPEYKCGLQITGNGLGLTLENEFYTVRLGKKSGAIDEISMKMGVDYSFYHHLETNGALHWNPGVYAPPRPWLHASDWDPPELYSSITGSLFATTSRSGSFAQYPEINIGINYTFYDQVPWILITSTIEVLRDIDLKALRNGEIVLDRKLVEEFAWCEPDGTKGSMFITDGPRHPRQAKVLAHDTPWACFFKRDQRAGLAVLTVDLAHFHRDGRIPRLFQPYYYLHWGPWVYYARPLVYTFLSAAPGRQLNVPAGNFYYEKMAYIPVRIDEDKKMYDYLDKVHAQISHPLYVDVVEDTDPRAPKKWMAPVLVEEFEEMDD